jgi:UMF1 family MFS transporter
MAALLPIFYSTVAAGSLPRNVATAYWGYTTSISLLFAALLSPVIGAAADLTGRRKRTVLAAALLGAAGTGLLATVEKGEWLFASLFYMAGHIPFVISFVCYDSLLPFVARRKDLDRVSTRGFAIGYLGGGLLLLINSAMVLAPHLFSLPSPESAIRVSFLTVALWWLLFSIPLARRVPEPPPTGGEAALPLSRVATEAFHRLYSTLKEIRRHPEPLKFLLAFWLYADGIGTVIKMAVIYGAEVGIGQNDLIGALLLVQFIGLPCSLLFGKIAGRIGARSGILIGLAVYAAIAGGGYFLSKPWHFWVLALLVGAVQGGTQALSRSLFASLIPREKSGEWFGFYSVSGRFAGIAGPFLFAATGHLTGSSRFGILTLLLFFVGGALLLRTVKVQAHPDEDGR